MWVCSGQSNMQYPIGSPTCWNASNINCTVKDQQCGYGCSENAGVEITDMVGAPSEAYFDCGMPHATFTAANHPSPVNITHAVACRKHKHNTACRVHSLVLADQ